MAAEDIISFAYKYPFSGEAKELISSAEKKSYIFSDRFLELAKVRLEEAFAGKKIEFRKIKYGQLDYIIGYAYARMLVSAMGNRYAISTYAEAEASRSKDAMEGDSDINVARLSEELGLKLKLRGEEFEISLSSFLAYTAEEGGLSLTNFKLHAGSVLLGKHDLAEALGGAMRHEISKGLPIKQSTIPSDIVLFAKTIPQPKIIVKGIRLGKGLVWVEQLLNTPIPDVRHRTVNLILAPYLVNIKGLGEEEASKIISDYIVKCKAIDPNTRITDSYIRYQCGYAKRKGLRPLSFIHAKELLGDFIEMGQESKSVVKNE